MNSNNRFILTNLLSFEFVLLNLVVILYLYFLPQFSLSDPLFIKNSIGLLGIYNLSWLFIILYVRDNEFYFSDSNKILKSLVVSVFFFVGLVGTLSFLTKIEYFNRSTFILPIFAFAVLNLIVQKFLRDYFRKKSEKMFSNALLISTGYELPNLGDFVRDMGHYGYNIVGYLKSGEVKPSMHLGFKIYGSTDRLNELLETQDIAEIFISMKAENLESTKKIIEIADSHGVRVKIIPENPYLKSKNFKLNTMGDFAVLKLRQSPLDNYNKTVLKRLFDFCFALMVIILFSPFYLLISLMVVLESRGPVIYAPLRKGEAGKSFKCYKFRTMRNSDNPLNGSNSTTKNDPRITRFGKILRKTGLDETPQFFNVLMGDMSVIGPRPHRTNLQNDFRKCVSNYMVRSYVKPGITGWAQVNGWRGPTVTEEQKTQRVKHDLWYIENWSFWLDVKIVYMTIFGEHHKNAF